MKKMFNIFLILSFLLISIGNVQAASAVNTSIIQKIQPSGSDGLLEISWTGRPDSEGYIYLPISANQPLWNSTEVKGAVLTAEKPEEVKIEGVKVHRWQVKAMDNSVTLKSLYTLPKLFALKEVAGDAEGGPTRRGDIQSLKYVFDNTLSNGITNYSFSVLLPKGYEVFKVVSPKKYTLSQIDGLNQITVNLKGKDDKFALLPGKSNVVELEYVQSEKGVIPIWIGIILISAGVIIYRRDIICSKSGGK